jgi:FixJ family two-component response regulator
VVEKMTNPWNLSDREAAAMTAVIKHGRVKGAARAMEISPKAAECLFQVVRKKMGVISLVQAAVNWDRHLREQVTA